MDLGVSLLSAPDPLSSLNAFNISAKIYYLFADILLKNIFRSLWNH